MRYLPNRKKTTKAKKTTKESEMPVTEVTTDPQNLTMTLIADFAAPIERVWQAFTDPRQLERFWGPPGWPATFTDYNLTPGGHVSYYMTSPEGQRSAGVWQVLSVNEPHGFEVLDAFADDNGETLTELPSMRVTYSFEPTNDGTRLTNVTFFESAEALEQVVAMGAIEGSTMAMDQLDAVLIDLREYAQGRGTQVEILDDTHVRITRLINGPRDLVWRAHHDPELVRQWMLGPDGWQITEIVTADAAGQSHRTSWAPVGDTPGEPFGFEGEVLVSEPPRREVSTERMQGVPDIQNINDLSLYEEGGLTLLTLLITYPDAATRDMILATGMADGMEASYARLEEVVLG